MILMKEVSKSYYLSKTIAVEALKDISLEIESGEFVSIKGTSGAGKSTLLNLIGCLDIAGSGSYLFKGIDVSKMNDYELARIRNKEIGFVFQTFNLLPNLTALRNIELALSYNRSLDRRDYQRLAHRVLDQVGLKQRAHHRPSELSGGEQQRVAIARAIVNDPSVILADEPTGNLDEKTGRQIMEILKTLNKKGTAILMVTHDESVAGFANRQVILADGRIVSDQG
ncbi:MAG: ABC transporter ATP-binding protein [bacterium]